jgi:hypothetical protein
LEEEVYPIQKAIDNPTKIKSKDGKRKKQEERERYGKRMVGKNSTVSSTVMSPTEPVAPTWSIPVKVVKEQPLLGVTRSSEAAMGALMVFEGER